jgi:hypothetical protein
MDRLNCFRNLTAKKRSKLAIVNARNSRKCEIAARGGFQGVCLNRGAIGERIGIARAKLLAIPNGDARAVTAQDPDAIITELREKIAEAVDALRPILPGRGNYA